MTLPVPTPLTFDTNYVALVPMDMVVPDSEVLMLDIVDGEMVHEGEKPRRKKKKTSLHSVQLKQVTPLHLIKRVRHNFKIILKTYK